MALDHLSSQHGSAFAAVHSLALRGCVASLAPGDEELLDAGLVRPVPGGGFQLTELGHSRHRALLESERETLDLNRLALAYSPVPALDRMMSRLRGDWRQPCGALARRRLTDRLCELTGDTAPVLRRTAVIAPRFLGYLPRLRAAAVQLRAGDQAYAFDLDVESIGVIWAELHEDFLQTLGRGHESENM